MISFFEWNKHASTVNFEGNRLARLLGDSGQWERKRVYVLNFSQPAGGEDCNGSARRQRSEDLSLADEGLRGGGNYF